MNLPRMACAETCPLRFRRFHATCAFCHLRRGRAAQRNPKKYRYACDGYFKGQRSYTTIFLAVDNNRRFAYVKNRLLAKIMVLAEVLAN